MKWLSKLSKLFTPKVKIRDWRTVEGFSEKFSYHPRNINGVYLKDVIYDYARVTLEYSPSLDYYRINYTDHIPEFNKYYNEPYNNAVKRLAELNTEKFNKTKLKYIYTSIP